MFLYMETPTNHMHVAGVFVLDPTTAPGGFSFAQVRAMVARRLHRAAPFRRRLVTLPFGIAHPVWIEDPEFDLDYHVRRACLPSPGSQAELEEFVGQIVGQPLDQQRPLWEMYVVEGLAGGLQALVVKMHHAAIDGVSGVELTAAWLDREPDPQLEIEDVDNWRPQRSPTEIDLLVSACAQLAFYPAEAARTTRRCLEAALKVSALNLNTEVPPPPRPFSAPRTSFNLAITPHRRVAVGEVALADLRAVKKHFDCTLNDVVLAICAGALRRYLLVRGELPEAPLVAFVPMSVRADEERLTGGNRLSAMLTSLATQIAEPVERLRAISRAASQAKFQATLIGADALTNWTEFTAPALIGAAARLMSSTRVFDRIPPAFNVTISNVPGPQDRLFLAGARLVAMYPLGPVVEGAGLNMTVMSYCDTMYFGLSGCRTLMPDIAALPNMMAETLAELLPVVRAGRPAGADPGPNRQRSRGRPAKSSQAVGPAVVSIPLEVW
jgi:WS/DGAT/MGAT family acyltransferase